VCQREQAEEEARIKLAFLEAEMAKQRLLNEAAAAAEAARVSEKEKV
jgi:hypothetical protein